MWWCRGSISRSPLVVRPLPPLRGVEGGIPCAILRCICHKGAFVKQTLAYLASCIVRGRGMGILLGKDGCFFFFLISFLGGQTPRLVSRKGEKAKHPPAFLWHIGSGLHVSTGCRKVYAVSFVTLDKESNMSTLWRREVFRRICSEEDLTEKAG